MLFNIVAPTDSILISKVDLLTKSVDSLQDKIFLSPWITLIAAVSGGTLVLIGQAIDRNKRRKQERLEKINTAFIECELILFNIKNSVKELSGYKNQSNYWYYNHERNNEDTEESKKYSERYYEKSLKESEKAGDCKIKIGDLFAQFYSNVSKFEIISGEKIVALENLQTPEFDDALFLDGNLSEEQAINAFHENHANLSGSYLLSIAPLNQINEQMQAICKNLND